MFHSGKGGRVCVDFYRLSGGHDFPFRIHHRERFAKGRKKEGDGGRENLIMAKPKIYHEWSKLQEKNYRENMSFQYLAF